MNYQKAWLKMANKSSHYEALTFLIEGIIHS